MGDFRFDCRWSRRLAVLSDWLHISFKFRTLSSTTSQLMTHILLPLSKTSPVTDPEGPGGFQEVKVPRFRDNGTGWW